ncbi:MAG: hydantoinase B/oxoprolinase family protein [Thermoleophilia bacterium]|nr:hydantoinase B/oxoprolinase family protein [Thermoleophilia bacterium]
MLPPARLEVIREGTTAVAEEMKYDLMRTARSPVLREAGDLSCALTDGAGRTVAQGHDIPMHLGVLSFTVRQLLERIPRESLRPGDVWFTNHPSCGGNHLPDVKAVRPVFVGGDLAAFAVALAHWPDVGGMLPGSYVPFAREIFQEGLVIPPTRLFAAEGPCDDALALVLANVRGAEERLGDIRAQAATTSLAEQRLSELFDTHGPEAVSEAWRRMQDESEERTRRALSRIPDGVYTGADALDDDGIGEEPVSIRVDVSVAGEHATFDFRRSDPAALGPVNTTPFIAAASVAYTVRALLGPEIASNDGLLRPLAVVTEPGSLLEPGPTAPLVAGNHETSQRIVDVLLRALAPALPDRVVAGGMGSSGLALFAGRRADGRDAFLYETHGGGAGASAARDGDSATRIHMSNVMNTPAEVIESEYPLRVERHELREGSGGAGVHRGGDGLRRAYRVLAEGMRLTTMVERCRVPPWGLEGGEDGQPSAVFLLRGRERIALRGKGSVELRPGDVVVVETAGGGGWGSPDARDADPRPA